MTSHSHTHSNSYGNHAYMFDHQQADYYSSMPAGHGMPTPKRDPAELSPSHFRQHHIQDDPLPGNLSLSQLRQYHQDSEDSSKYVSCANTPSPSDSYQGGLPSEEPSCSSDSSTSQQHLDFMHHSSNSLGLVGNMNPPSPHSIKISSFGVTHEALLRPAMLQRQISSSNLSDTSGSSYFNDGASIGSHSQIDPTSPIRSSFTPAQSPLGLSHSISSLSGLAIGAHQAPPPPSFELSREGGQRYATFQGRNHDDLLSLSGSVHLMHAPTIQQTKRRSTCGAHTLYTTSLQQLRDERANEDKTPMPPSTQTFMGQHSPDNDVSQMSHQYHSGVPLTPSRSNGDVDADLYRNGTALSLSAPRLRRMDSIEGAQSGTLSSPMGEFGPPLHNPFTFHGRSLEDAFVEQEAKMAAQNYHFQQQQDQQHQMGLPKHPSLSHLSSSAMSRVSSAPISGQMAMGNINYGMPGTPSRTTNFLQHMQQTQQHQHQRFPSFPHTPINNASSHSNYDVSFSAPQMMPSRSMGNMQSPFASSMMSPMSLIDHGTPGSEDTEGDMNVQSPSSGVTRTMTPKIRGGAGGASVRGNIPPPLIVSSADKLHVCFCGKRFKRLEHLKRHNRVHTQERPHPCPAPGCNKWFGRTDNLTQHLKTHYRTLGRSSENLLNITNAKASTLSHSNHSQPAEPRHDPHAAAAAAAAQAVSKTNAKSAASSRRNAISSNHDGSGVLGGPISLNRPGSNSPTATSNHQFSNSNNGNTQSIKLSPSPIGSPIG